jgi:DNA-binding CsgD family transcriptional regulator/tetratricopeptide (TPR) repeat protein
VLSPARLVGRGVEIGKLDDEYRRAAAGEFRVVVLTGDPGLGKTRLAREFLARKSSRAAGLFARGYPFGTTSSFGVWSEALDRHLRTFRPDEIAALCGGSIDDLAILLRSVAVGHGSVRENQPSWSRLLSALGVLLENLTTRQPIIVVIDDAHDADPSSWEALAYLARDLASARMLVLAVARPFELGENRVAVETLRRLEQDGALSRIGLQPFDVAEMGKLVEAVLHSVPPKTLLEWLSARCGGNPLFALGLVQALIDESADLSSPALRSIPEALSERVASDVRKLEEPAVAVLESLATLDRRLELRDVIDISGLPAERVARIMSRLVQSRFVVEDVRGQEVTYAVAHPLIQEAIYQQIGAARRRVVHRELARALFVAGRLGEAAPHFARSAAIGDDEAIRALCDAVCQCEAREAFREALTILGALVSIIPRDDLRWLDVLKALSWRAEWVVDHRADTHALLGIEAMRTIDRILEPLPDAAAQAMVKFHLANFLGWGSGDLDEAEEKCREALERFEQVDDAMSSQLVRNELAWLRGLHGDLDGMARGAAAVAAAGERIGEPFVRIHGFQAWGFAAGWSGRFAEAESAWQRGNAIARDEGKDYRLTIGLVGLAVDMAAQGRIQEATAHIEMGKRAYRRWTDSLLPEWQCGVHWFAGDFHRALACAREFDAGWLYGLSKRRALGVVFAALASIEAGEMERARQYQSSFVRTFGERDWMFFSHLRGHVEGLLQWVDGRLMQACGTLGSAADRVFSAGALPYAATIAVDLAQIAGERGDPEGAAAAATNLESIADRLDVVLYHGLAAMGSAWAALAAEDLDRAELKARSAIDLLAGTGCRAYHARALEVLGRSLASRGQPDAIENVRQAVAMFDACGAVWRRDRTKVFLRSFGHRGRRAASSVAGLSVLSRRERQVAELAVQGFTAAEIGARLDIGERTVETHLASIYAKLGVKSKLDLIRQVAGLSLNF